MCSKISTNLDSSETPHSRSARFELSKAQLQAYFSSIGLPPTHLSSPLLAEPLLACTQAHGLPFLAALMRHHLASIPYENLAIHYSSSREFVPSISMLDMQEIYSLIVERGTGRGGMCMQINGLFGTVLRSLGFEIMSTAARINTACQDVARTAEYEGPTYNGWNHMVNLVTLSSQRYLVDVGMGAKGPMVPIPLIPGASVFSISPRTARLLHGCIPEHTSSATSNALWRLEVRNHEVDEWTPAYAFSEIEFLPVDFEVMNWYTSTNPQNWLARKVLVGKMILDEKGNEIVGDLTLFEKTFRRRIHGQVDLEVQCVNEGERVKLLKKYFGIKLTVSEQEGIKEKVSEIS